MTKPTWGLTLSGGAAWGIANAGVVEVLDREGLRPDCVAGSSMGAIVAALWACGYGAAEMREICAELTALSIFTIDGMPWKNAQLHQGTVRQKPAPKLAELLRGKTIGDCVIPFTCVAGRVRKPVEWKRILLGNFTEYFLDCIEPHVFGPDTPLLDAVMASSALPILFHPVQIGDDTFVDLANFGAIPVRQLDDARHPDLLIATDTNPRYTEFITFLPPGWRTYIEDGAQSIQENLDLCDLVIRPELKHSTVAFEKHAVFWEAGKKAAEEALPGLRSLLR